MGAAIRLATTFESAPGYEAETCTVGGAISGYWATGRNQTAMPPASVITIDSTEAKIGRKMKKRENTRHLPDCVRNLPGEARTARRPLANEPATQSGE